MGSGCFGAEMGLPVVVVSAGRKFPARFLLVASCALSVFSICNTPSQPGNAAFAVTPSEPALESTDRFHARLAQPSDTLTLANLQEQFVAVAERVAPSVVAISAAVNEGNSDELAGAADLSPQRLRQVLDHVTRTVGTGLVIGADGYILTNEHVIAETEQIWITTDDRRVFPALVVGSDPRADLAVLKIPATNLKPVTFAEYGAVKRGQWSIALGNPFGLAQGGAMAMSVGIVSALDRRLATLSSREDRNYTNLIQTTAEINPGNSGGPLFDIEGNVVGISTAVVLPQKQTNGIGFAIPITRAILDRVCALREGQEIVYGYLGVVVSTPGAKQRIDAGAPDRVGVAVDSIDAHSPAAGNLKAGDIVTTINGKPVADSDRFVDAIGTCSTSEPTELRVFRNGKSMDVRLCLARRAMPSVAVNRDNQRLRWRGMLLGPIPTNWDFGKSPRPENGLMVLAVKQDSPMLKQGVTTGAVITKVAGKVVHAVTDLQSILNETPAEQCSVQLVHPQGQVATAKD